MSQEYGECKHGEFILREGCPQCIARRHPLFFRRCDMGVLDELWEFLEDDEEGMLEPLKVQNENDLLEAISEMPSEQVARFAFKALSRARYAMLLSLMVLNVWLDWEGVPDEAKKECRLAVMEEAIKQMAEVYRVKLGKL